MKGGFLIQMGGENWLMPKRMTNKCDFQTLKILFFLIFKLIGIFMVSLFLNYKKYGQFK